MAVGPFTPGFVADQRIASELAEIGVALLLFGIGLHFSLADLLAVRRIAIPGGLLQVALATGIGTAVGWLIVGLPLAGSLIIGLSLAIASTAVATRALEERGTLDARPSRISTGWLVVQDIGHPRRRTGFPYWDVGPQARQTFSSPWARPSCKSQVSSLLSLSWAAAPSVGSGSGCPVRARASCSPSPSSSSHLELHTARHGGPVRCFACARGLLRWGDARRERRRAGPSAPPSLRLLLPAPEGLVRPSLASAVARSWLMPATSLAGGTARFGARPEPAAASWAARTRIVPRDTVQHAALPSEETPVRGVGLDHLGAMMGEPVLKIDAGDRRGQLAQIAGRGAN